MEARKTVGTMPTRGGVQRGSDSHGVYYHEEILAPNPIQSAFEKLAKIFKDYEASGFKRAILLELMGSDSKTMLKIRISVRTLPGKEIEEPKAIVHVRALSDLVMEALGGGKATTAESAGKPAELRSGLLGCNPSTGLI